MSIRKLGKDKREIQGDATRLALLAAGPAVRWDAVTLLEPRHGAVGSRGALRQPVPGGVIEPRPLRPLALLLAGARSEAGFFVAGADAPLVAREEVGRLIVRILE